MEEERLMILKMLEEGKITSAEAAALLEALDDHGETVVVSPGEAADAGSGAPGEPDEIRSDDSWKATGEERRGETKAIHVHCSRDRHGENTDFWDDVEQRAEHFSARVSRAAEELGERLGRLGEELGERIPAQFWSSPGAFSFGPGYRFSQTAEGRFDKDRSIEIILRNTNGGIAISGWDQEGYRVELEKTVGGHSEDDARRRAERCVRLEMEPDRLRVVSCDENRVSVRMQVFVPRTGEYELNLNSSNGGIRLKDIRTTDSKLHTANGRIILTGVTGDDLSISSANGRIEGVMDAREISANTANGSIDITLLGAPGGDYHFQTTNGPVKVGIPAEWPCEIEAANGWGSISLEAQNAVIRENVVRAGHRRMEAFRDGQGETTEINVRSSNGAIVIHDAGQRGGEQG